MPASRPSWQEVVSESAACPDESPSLDQLASEVRDGADGVGIATNLAIVNGAVFCIVTNLLMSWMMYG